MSADNQLSVMPLSVDAPCMFLKEILHDEAARVIIIGKPSRKTATACLNTPITAELHRRLKENIVGSMSMGSAVLIEWALDELETRSLAIEARPKT